MLLLDSYHSALSSPCSSSSLAEIIADLNFYSFGVLEDLMEDEIEWAEEADKAAYGIYYQAVKMLFDLENTPLPSRGYHRDLVRLMRKYGWKDSSGWWTRSDEK